MVILVDMDDTIEHLLVPWLDWLNRKFGRNVRKSDVHSWDMRIAYPGLTLEEIFGALDEEEFWDTVPPIEGAAEVLERWMKQGHRVYIVTATPPKSVQAKMERVLFRYFPYLMRILFGAGIRPSFRAGNDENGLTEPAERHIIAPAT